MSSNSTLVQIASCSKPAKRRVGVMQSPSKSNVKVITQLSWTTPPMPDEVRTIITMEQRQVAGGDSRRKWFNSPVTYREGTLAEIRQYVPSFERRSFGLTQPNSDSSRLNERLDTIVRLPVEGDETFIPIGIVSKEYVLVPHDAVLDFATNALKAEKIAPDDLKSELTMIEYGERMALTVYLPNKFSFDPGDGPMALRLECFNSVDGSSRFRALMGWFRLVCSNGLIIGVTRSGVRRRHSGDLRLEQMGLVLTSGLKDSETEKKNLNLGARPKLTSANSPHG